ncbi:hypothetical protein [Candidatus Methanoperedens nitratireducens]|uniref:hypothetical protein n=1 Tax=Candidatus Methanoperedens nitratireducens TaxID=1392998 RepID=UPI001177489C|nr:hypothetical protein [Candidatus Methanoperedens nitroreducens]
MDRKYARESYWHKTVLVSLNVGEKYVVSSVVKVNVNKVTGVVSFAAAGLRINGCDVHPGKNQKLRCTNQHALEVIERKRNWQREYNIEYNLKYKRKKELLERESGVSACSASQPADCKSLLEMIL